MPLCGGVACNSRLRGKLEEACRKSRRDFIAALPKYCTDNAAMIAGLTYHYFKKNAAGVGSEPFAINARLDRTLGKLPFAPDA